MGALASAEHTLTRARALIGPDDPVLRAPVDEALTEVFAMSGQVDRAIEMGKTLLARLGGRAAVGPGSGRCTWGSPGRRSPARGGRRPPRASRSPAAPPGADAAQVDACAAQVAVGRGELAEADELARAALAAAESGGLPEVACEALEVIGRVARQRDLDAAERAFARAGRWPARTGCGCGGCGRCTSWARSTSCAPRARPGWSRRASWRWPRARWP